MFFWGWVVVGLGKCVVVKTLVGAPTLVQIANPREVPLAGQAWEESYLDSTERFLADTEPPLDWKPARRFTRLSFPKARTTL